MRMAREEIANARNIPRPSPLNQQLFWGLAAVLGIAWALQQANVFGRDLVNETGLKLALAFFRAGFHPDLRPDFLIVVLKATLVTLAYAVIGSVFSILLGFVGGVLSSEVWWQAVFPSGRKALRRIRGYRIPWLGFRTIFAAPRAIHEIIWGLFFVNILGLTPLTAILAITFPYSAITAKVFSEILDETPHQPLDTLLNSGVAPPQALLYGLLPQAFPNLLSYAFYRFECSIRAATALGIIGAGGLGYEIFLSLQSLRYEQMWTLLFALFLLSGLTGGWSNLLRRKLKRSQTKDLRHHNISAIGVSLIGIAVLFAFSLWLLKPNLLQLFSSRTFELFINLARDSFPLALNISIVKELFSLAGQTLAMSILAMTFAGFFGILLSFPAANLSTDQRYFTRNIKKRMRLFLPIRAFLLALRSIPAPIWALLLLFVFFPGILPGALALGLYTLGILGRLMAEVIENLDDRPLRALSNQGASRAQVFFYGVLPGAATEFTAYIIYRWEVCIRTTVIVGLVGAGGLGRLLTEQLSSFDYPGVMTTLFTLLGLTLLVDLIGNSVRRSLR